MRHVSEVMTLEPYTQKSERLLDSTRALKVWAQLAELFGKAFYRENGDLPTNLWIQATARLSDEQIANGLANLGNAGLAFPPNLSQFLEACKREKLKAPYWDAPQIEDQRPAEKMTYAEWKKLNGV